MGKEPRAGFEGAGQVRGTYTAKEASQWIPATAMALMGRCSHWKGGKVEIVARELDAKRSA